MKTKHTTHTPGPWILDDEEPYIVILEASESFRHIAGFDDSEFMKEETQANARLIAAAPEMLEALQEVAKLPVAGGYVDGPCLESWMMDEVKAAIAKATGEGS